MRWSNPSKARFAFSSSVATLLRKGSKRMNICAALIPVRSQPHISSFQGVFGGEEEGGGVRSGLGEARTILLLHIISVSPSKQSLIVRTFLKVYMVLGSYFVSVRAKKRHRHRHVLGALELAGTTPGPLAFSTCPRSFAWLPRTWTPHRSPRLFSLAGRAIDDLRQSIKEEMRFCTFSNWPSDTPSRALLM
jgi:hypothetical protein